MISNFNGMGTNNAKFYVFFCFFFPIIGILFTGKEKTFRHLTLYLELFQRVLLSFQIIWTTFVHVTDLVSLFNGISTFVDDLMPKTSLYKNSSNNILTISAHKSVHKFLMCIRPKANLLSWLEFKPAYFNITVQNVCYYTTETPSLRSSYENTKWLQIFCISLYISNYIIF